MYRNDGNEMKEKFLKPEMEVITFNGEDIITTSGCGLDCPGDCGFNCAHDCLNYCQNVSVTG